MTKLCLTTTFLTFLALNGPIYGAEFTSGAEKVRLLELYTSQSCSSCPPAEKWLTRMKSSGDLWKSFVPISYHVAYWNHLSWKDTFSKESFSNRQRAYHYKTKSGVYTPQFVLDGVDFRNWRSYRHKNSLQKVEGVGQLKVNFNEKKKRATLTFSPSGKKALNQNLLCHGAYLESDHPIKITSGENEGVSLTQDFVAIQLAKTSMNKKSKQYKCTIDLETKATKSNIRRSVAFWLVDKDTYQVVQATGGDLK